MPTDRLAINPMQITNVEVRVCLSKTFIIASKSVSIHKNLIILRWSRDDSYFPAVNSLFPLECSRFNPASRLDAGDIGDVRKIEPTFHGAFVRIDGVAWSLTWELCDYHLVRILVIVTINLFVVFRIRHRSLDINQHFDWIAKRIRFIAKIPI